MKLTVFLYSALIIALTFSSQNSLADEVADVIYHGGVVLTIDDKNPTAEAVAVMDGKIVAVGKRDEVLKFKGDTTTMIDLKGKTLLPGFIDSHGHLINAGLQRSVAILLPPPDGEIDSIGGLQNLLKDWADSDAAKRIAGGKLIIGFGYDDAQLKEKRHPTRQDLDAISSDKPVVIIHQSGHLGVMNSRALQMAGITVASQDPLGGLIRREQDGKTPNGVLEETAWIQPLVALAIPEISLGNERRFIEQGQLAYLEFGFTTAQEGRATEDNLKQLVDAAASGLLKIDVIAYPDPSIAKNIYENRWHGPDYKEHFRVGGVKFGLDGSPQGKTAWLTEPYKVPPPGQSADYKGYPTYRDEQVFPMIKEAVEKEWQVIAHCSGDAACEQFIDALKASGTPEVVRANRPVMIHAHAVREDQLDEMEKLGIIPSFFNMHTYYWGDWHRDEIFGKERAFRLEPAASCVKRKMVWTSHHDAPVALPDSIRILSSCVTRKSRSGEVIGPDQRVSMAEALKALTINAAYQYGEENSKGSIEVGKLADFVILSQNPMTIDPDKIMDIKVLETIKEGQSIYTAK